MLPDGYGNEAGMPLRHKHAYWGTEGACSVLCCNVEPSKGHVG